MKLAIAIASGTLKGVFGHGVLSALESKGIQADAYGTASSSVLSGGLAAIGQAQTVGVSYWLDVAKRSESTGMSDVVLYSIDKYGALIKQALFQSQTPAFFIAASQVITSEAQEMTQGAEARKLGRKLLVEALKKQNAWAVENLQKTLFSSKTNESMLGLHDENFNEVAYASTRMLHAWEKPAWVNGTAFVDGSYTCSCPAIELAQAGYEKLVVILAEPGVAHNDLFQSVPLTKETLSPSTAYFVQPDYDLKTIGVDFTSATEEGMRQAYQHGYEKGLVLGEQLIAEGIVIKG